MQLLRLVRNCWREIQNGLVLRTLVWAIQMVRLLQKIIMEIQRMEVVVSLIAGIMHNHYKS